MVEMKFGASSSGARSYDATDTAVLAARAAIYAVEARRTLAGHAAFAAAAAAGERVRRLLGAAVDRG